MCVRACQEGLGRTQLRPRGLWEFLCMEGKGLGVESTLSVRYLCMHLGILCVLDLYFYQYLSISISVFIYLSIFMSIYLSVYIYL